jgi:aminoglycoside phosphotransferase (APT) family kinase protein
MELLDAERLGAWARQRGLGTGPIEGVRVLGGGSQNVLIRFSLGKQRFVLRRPALHARPDAARTVAREAQVLAALGGTDVPHARLAAPAEDSNEVIGAPFYVMEYVDGFPVLDLPGDAGSEPAFRKAMSLALVDALARLAAVNPASIGLAGFGRLEDFLERQVPRWARQLERYAEFDSWPGPSSLPGISELGGWLEANRPASFAPGLMHGDYHIGNAVFRTTPDGCEVAAIVDWEMAALGAPLLDLARLLVSWPDASGQSSLTLPVDWSGFPSREELIAHYQLRTGADLSELPWFEMLACYKLAIILEGSYARACAGLVSPDSGDRLHASALKLLARARGILESAP